MGSSKDHFLTFRIPIPRKSKIFREYLREIAAKIETIPWCESRAFGLPICQKIELKNLVQSL